MRDLDLTSLRLFVAVCETRNIARADRNAGRPVTDDPGRRDAGSGCAPR